MSDVSETTPVRIRERSVLKKYEGDIADGKLIEIVEIVDGRIVQTTRVTEES